MNTTAIKPAWGYATMLMLLVVFIILKWEHLFVPHYWDESWSYATAVHAMYDAGPRLLPGNVDPVYTRGHPLLFYFLSSGWMKLFGATLFSKHVFALSVSIAMIVALCYIGKRLFQNIWAGVGLSALWMAQSMFFVQSAMLLPEVMVALFSLLAIYAFSARQWWALALWLSLLLLTKESGLVVWGGIGLAGLVVSIQSRDWGYFKKMFVSLFIPLAVIIGFFTYQYSVYGWVFFPEHVGMMQLSLGYVEGILSSIFALKANLILIISIAIISVLIYIKNKQLLSLSIGLLPLLLWLFTFMKPFLGGRFSIIFIVGLALVFIFIMYRLLTASYQKSVLQDFICTALIVSFCYIGFCAINFFTVRYLMPYTALLCFFVMLQCVRLYKYYPRRSWQFTAYAVPLLGAVGFLLSTVNNNGDVSLGAFNAVRVQKAMVNYMVAHVPKDAYVAWGSYQMTFNLSKPACGFLPSDHTGFTNLHYDITTETDYVIFDSIEKDAREEDLMKSGNFEMVFEENIAEVVGRVYKAIK